MLSGFILTAMLTFAPGQAETAPAPQTLPPVEGMRPSGSLPTPAEVALPPAVGCPSCSPSVASYPPGCASGNCYGTTCNTEPTGPPLATWTNASFLYYWMKAAPLPALLDGPNGQPLNGNGANFGASSGGQISGGRWVNDAHTLGFGYSGFMIEQRASFFNVASDATGNPLLTRPFTDALTAQPGNFFVADPNRLNGSFSAASGLRLSGGELYGMKSVFYTPSKNFTLLAGFRYLDLDEYLEIYQQTGAAGGANPVPAFTVANQPTSGPVNLVDRFRTRNQFYGFEIGGRGECSWGPVSFGVTSKVGIGNNAETLQIAGQTTAAGAPTTQGGLLALSPNIGSSYYGKIALLADVSAEVGIQLSKSSRLFVAYDFIYLNDVIRPGTQVDTVINNRYVPTSTSYGSSSGPASPLQTRGQTDFYAHGCRFGYQFQY